MTEHELTRSFALPGNFVWKGYGNFLNFLPEIVGPEGEVNIINLAYASDAQRHGGDVPCLKIASREADWIQIGVCVLRVHAYVHVIAIRISALRREDARGRVFILPQPVFHTEPDFVDP